MLRSLGGVAKYGKQTNRDTPNAKKNDKKTAKKNDKKTIPVMPREKKNGKKTTAHLKANRD